MLYIKAQRLLSVLDALPNVFNVQPTHDYAQMVSHSSAEIASKAWARTALQFRGAAQHFEQNHPDVVEQAQRLSKQIATNVHSNNEPLQRQIKRVKEWDQLAQDIEERLHRADEQYLRTATLDKGKALGQH